ncbi:MAG TPA: TSUP family transporter [Thermoanaerobaculia bacterium]|nr:TSUP family transporter [Thermoanaerobaculia bacterium]
MSIDPSTGAALFAVGLVAGVINAVAGGGSFLTLPALIFLGLPPTLANGTNRVGILLQNVAALVAFDRHVALDRSWAVVAALPALAGAGLGTWGALVISGEAFKKVLAFLMLAVTVWTLLDPTARRRPGSKEEGEPEPPPPWREAPSGRRWVIALGFFAAGVYGGFVQAGVGFLILAVTTLAGFDLVRGNAMKALVILCFTVLSLTLFAAQGQVDWALGLLLAVGSAAGGWLGARLTISKGHRWVRGMVTAAVVVFAVLLWFD